MNSDFSDLLRLFNAYRVRYLVVSGHAVMLYTEPRYTKDLDLWIDAVEDNAESVFRALAEFGAPLSDLSPSDFSRPGFFYQLGRPPARIDILMSIAGVEFGEAWSQREEGLLGGEKALFIGRRELIRNKRASGRHIDLHDAALLEAGGLD